MKNKFTKFLIAFTILFTMNSCEVIGGIFKAGMGVGIFIVIAIIAVIIFIVSSFFKNND
ncbi:hypothetical protein [Flavobacterium taihuense]|uniref:Phosphatidate cytidylyltransferase n=1 Tax=Flavobacterium taihuense TaxID=2857508 RepID=A0ABS6XZT7_9FLAO|nr:hypothetical protein [Flavobacterium taihuense]MBW4362175.1 hypothetical protein [Flavobacterium taihuense]